MIWFNTRSRKAGLSSVDEASVAKKQENALSETEDESLSSSLSSFSSTSSSRDSANIFQYHEDEVQSLNGETEQDDEAASTTLRTSNNDDDEVQSSHQVIEDRLRHRINELQDELARRIDRTNKLRTAISSIDSDDDYDEQVSKSMKELEANEDELRKCIVELEEELAQRLLRTGSTDHPSVDGSELRSDDSVVVLTESIENSNLRQVNLWDEDNDDDHSIDSSVAHSDNKAGTSTQCEIVCILTEFDMRADDSASEEETFLGMWTEVDMTTTPTCESSSTDDNSLSSTKKELANNSSSPVKLASVSEDRHMVCVEALAA